MKLLTSSGPFFMMALNRFHHRVTQSFVEFFIVNQINSTLWNSVLLCGEFDSKFNIIHTINQ